MNIKPILAWSAGGLILATTALTAQGFGPRMGGGQLQGQAGFCAPMTRLLSLTEAQQANLKAIEGSHQASLDAKLKAAEIAREAMRGAMHDASVGDARIKELRLTLTGATTEVMLERRAMLREFEAILTPDQKAALENQRLQGGFGQGMGRGGGRGQGFRAGR